MEPEIRTRSQSLRGYIVKHRIFSLITCLIFIAIVVFLGVQQYGEYSYGRKVGFQEYVPTWLPQGVQVTGRNVTVDHDTRFGTTSITFNLNLNHASTSYIQEDQVKSRYDTCGYYANSGQFCKSLTTPDGQRYILLTDSIAPINLRDQGIELYKGSINIYMRFQNYSGQPYSNVTLNHIVDSFTPVHYSRISGTTSVQCGCGD